MTFKATRSWSGFWHRVVLGSATITCCYRLENIQCQTSQVRLPALIIPELGRSPLQGKSVQGSGFGVQGSRFGVQGSR
ncbi:MAG TPA: hypothetical protein VNU68_17005, partial [Verrucomicrobiae bacterium]|nr:hypothetical protein [Verrucomicrobiae bacterium]